MIEILGELQGKKKALSNRTSATKLWEVEARLESLTLLGSHGH